MMRINSTTTGRHAVFGNDYIVFEKYDGNVKNHHHLEFTTFFGWSILKTLISIIFKNLR